MARFAVIGLGRFGRVVAGELSAYDAEVIAVDQNGDLIDNIADTVTLAIKLNATEQEALVSQGIDQVDVAIVAIGDDFEANCLVVSLLKGLNPDIKVYARATSEVRGRILESIGADTVVYPERESGERIARSLAFPGLIDPDEVAPGVLEARVPAPEAFVGKTPIELNLRQKYEVNLVAIQRPQHEPPVIIAQANTLIEAGDTLLLIGNKQQIEYLSTLPKSKVAEEEAPKQGRPLEASPAVEAVERATEGTSSKG